MHHGGSVFTGFLREYYDLDHDIAIVVVMSSLDVHVVPLKHRLELLPYTKVIALGYSISAKLMATIGVLTADSGSEYNDELQLSSCKISKVICLI